MMLGLRSWEGGASPAPTNARDAAPPLSRRLAAYGMSFFQPFFFLLLDSALGSDLLGAAAVCSLLVPAPAAGLAELDSVADGVPLGDAAAGAAAWAPGTSAGAADEPFVVAGLASAPAGSAAAGCSAEGAAFSTGTASIGFGRSFTSVDAGAEPFESRVTKAAPTFRFARRDCARSELQFWSADAGTEAGATFGALRLGLELNTPVRWRPALRGFWRLGRAW